MDTPCICGVPERYAGAPAFPIEHDIILNEYSIAYGTPGHSGILRMLFCFFMWRKLPESRRQAMFTQPDPIEQAAAKLITDQIKNTADMRMLLGEPIPS